MSLQSSVGGMQTKACPLFPILKWPQGNCLISNSGKVPEGRELYFYNLSIRSVTCLQHVVALIFFFSCNRSVCLLSGHVRGIGRLPGAASTEPLPLHTGMCACMPGHVLQPRGHSQGRLERENLKNRNCCVQENVSPEPHVRRKTKQRGRCAILRAHMWKVQFALT